VTSTSVLPDRGALTRAYEGCAFARVGGFAPSTTVVRGPSTGENPRLLPWRLASPLPSSTFGAFGAAVLEVPTAGARRYTHGSCFSARATLLTLTPTLPSRPDPCVPAWSSRNSSPGVVQRSPLHRSESGSPTPGEHVSVRPFGKEQPVPSACRPRGFAPPRRFVPPRPCRSVSPCSRSWGSPCFPSSRNEDPHGAGSALRSFPSADSYAADRAPAPSPFPACFARVISAWARVTGATIAGRPSPRALPSHPFPPTRCGFPRRCSEPGPQGLAPSSGPLHTPPLPAANARCSPGLVRVLSAAT